MICDSDDEAESDANVPENAAQPPVMAEDVPMSEVSGLIAGVVREGPPWNDTITGERLDPRMVLEGMNKERKTMRDRGVLTPTTWRDVRRYPDARIIRSGWVLVHKKSKGVARALGLQ